MIGLRRFAVGSPGLVAASGGGGSEVEVTWNPADKSTFVILTNSDRTAETDMTASSGFERGARATKYLSAGKFYCEFFWQITTLTGGAAVGMASSAWDVNSANLPTTGFSYDRGGFTKEDDANSQYQGAQWANNDVIQMAVDLDSALVWWGRNGTWLHSGNPSAGTGGKSVTARTYAVWCRAGGDSRGSLTTLRSLTADFSYSIPTGFVSLAAAQGV